MKFNPLILIAIFSFFLLSCDSGLKFENPLEKNDSDSIEAETHEGDGNKTDTSAEQEDKDKTDSVSEYDDDKTDTASTNNGDSGDSKPDEDKTDSDNSNTAPEQPDNSDSASEQSDDTDTTPDGDDFQPDDADSQSDDDADSSHGNEPEIGDTREADCTGLPATGAVWNTVSSITQSWNGSAWEPSNIATHNDEASTQECRYRCKEHYTWTNSICKADSKVVNCTEPPANAEWNTVSTISQTWNGSTWEPSNNTTFSEDATTNECHFKCAENYTWNDLECVGATRIKNCDGLPKNAVWNTASSITQQWTGYDWSPSSTGVYNTTASTDFCRYQCDEYSRWKNSKCISPCDSEPCVSVENSTGHCIAMNQDKYRCECENEYYWWGTRKGCSNKPLTIGNICTGLVNCYNYSETIACPAEGENYFGQDAQHATFDICIPQSFTSLSNVVVDNNTGLTWEKSPSSTKYIWASRNMHCNELNTSNYGGKSNWRVPNPLEFLTIVDNSKYNPATNSNFTGMPTGTDALWTNNDSPTNNNNAYYFSPSYGLLDNGPKTGQLKILCVSGEEMKPAVPADFTTSSDGKTVTDNRTGLMWQKEFLREDVKTWQRALKYCEDSSYAGYTDWHLPNKNELASLVNYEKSDYHKTYFPSMRSYDAFLSSSTYISSYTSSAWYWYSFGGTFSKVAKDYSGQFAICVRGGWDTSVEECIADGGHWNGTSCTTTFPECSASSVAPCKDSSSGLIWSERKINAISWDDAKSYCANLTEGGLSGWHLPTIDELKTLLIADRVQNNCRVSENCLSFSSCWRCSTCTQTGTQSSNGTDCEDLGSIYSDGRYSKFGDTGTFWSSSVLSNSSDIWGVNFSRGYVYKFGYYNSLDECYFKYSVRCARSE